MWCWWSWSSSRWLQRHSASRVLLKQHMHCWRMPCTACYTVLKCSSRSAVRSMNACLALQSAPCRCSAQGLRTVGLIITREASSGTSAGHKSGCKCPMLVCGQLLLVTFVKQLQHNGGGMCLSCKAGILYAYFCCIDCLDWHATAPVLRHTHQPELFLINAASGSEAGGGQLTTL